VPAVRGVGAYSARQSAGLYNSGSVLVCIRAWLIGPFAALARERRLLEIWMIRFAHKGQNRSARGQFS